MPYDFIFTLFIKHICDTNQVTEVLPFVPVTPIILSGLYGCNLFNISDLLLLISLTIICGNNIGRYAFIGAGAVVTKEVPDYALMVGNPSKNIGWMSEFGERLIFNQNGIAICQTTGSKYILNNNLVNKLDE